MTMSTSDLRSLIRAALQEDLGRGDLTTHALIPGQRPIQARIIAKAAGVAAEVFNTVDRRIRCTAHRQDGQTVSRGQVIMTLRGEARNILKAERTALNFLGHLSGIATLTHRFVKCVQPSRVKILDTRKTVPGLRALEKYAVRMGGGTNHRMRLDDAVLIKTNHLHIMKVRSWGLGVRGLIQEAIRRARQMRPKRFVEIEVSNMAEFKAALDAAPDAILLDNWRVADIRTAVRWRHLLPSSLHLPVLEVSGGVTLQNVRRIAATGVERISIGALTHSAPALDVSLHVVD